MSSTRETPDTRRSLCPIIPVPPVLAIPPSGVSTTQWEIVQKTYGEPRTCLKWNVFVGNFRSGANVLVRSAAFELPVAAP